MEGNFRKRLLINIAMIVGSFAILGTALAILAGAITATTVKITSDRLLIAQRTAVVSSLADLKHDAPAAEAYAKKINTILPSGDELLNFREYITGVAKSNQLVPSFAFQGAPSSGTKGNPGNAAFSIDVAGSFDNIKTFVNTLETKGAYFITFDTFDVNSSDASNYHALIQGKVFFSGA